MFQKLAYLVRSGPPDMLDRMVGMNFGTLAWHLTQNKEFGNMVAINHGNYNYVPIKSVVAQKRHVDVDKYYDRVNYVPCLLYTSDAADDLTRVDLGGRRII